MTADVESVAAVVAMETPAVVPVVTGKSASRGCGSGTGRGTGRGKAKTNAKTKSTASKSSKQKNSDVATSPVATAKAIAAMEETARGLLLKDMKKLFSRIERIFVPATKIAVNAVSAPLNQLLSRITSTHYCLITPNPPLLPYSTLASLTIKGAEPIFAQIDWEELYQAIVHAVRSVTPPASGQVTSGSADEGDGSIIPPPEYELPEEVMEELWNERRVHVLRLEKLLRRERLRLMQVRNLQPLMPGKWRKENFVTRQYEALRDYVPASAMQVGPAIPDNYIPSSGDSPEDNLDPQSESQAVMRMLDTPLDGFLGQPYNYDDHNLTEAWITTFHDSGSGNGATPEEVMKTQLAGLMEVMVAAVADRVANESSALRREPLVLGVDIEEVPVWGIDCYTRRMIELCVEDASVAAVEKAVAMESTNSAIPVSDNFDVLAALAVRPSVAAVQRFIEKELLPAINQQPPEMAHDITCALKYIVDRNIDAAKSDTNSSAARSVAFASATLNAITEYGIENFKVHPKGTGVVCIRPEGLPSHTLVAPYLGELYPAYRWCERLSVVEMAQKEFQIAPTLPDFHNILLERPRHDPKGYGLLYVDAGEKANVGSSCSHSCDSNCSSAVIAKNNKLGIVLTTNRPIGYGEELTMDYYSITNSATEWRAAICLCGTANCRGSFLHYATQEDLQQVLSLRCGPLWRFASLLRACTAPSTAVMAAAADAAVLTKHGIQSAVLGETPLPWAMRYAADCLRFIEFERKALPCALLRSTGAAVEAASAAAATASASGKSEIEIKAAADAAAQANQYTFVTADGEARMVMEQRVQSLACCFSQVRRVLAQQPDSYTRCKPPLRVADNAHVRSTLWKMLQALPALMTRYLLHSDGVNRRQSSSALLAAAMGSSPSGSQAASSQTIKRNDIAVKKAIASLEKLLWIPISFPQSSPDMELKLELSPPPSTMAQLRECMLEIRQIISGIAKYETPRARLLQLCDLLVLLSVTTNFSFASDYETVESGIVTVTARELGSAIPRSKIFAKLQADIDASTRRRSVSNSNTTQSNVNNEPSIFTGRGACITPVLKEIKASPVAAPRQTEPLMDPLSMKQTPELELSFNVSSETTSDQPMKTETVDQPVSYHLECQLIYEPHDAELKTEANIDSILANGEQLVLKIDSVAESNFDQTTPPLLSTACSTTSSTNPHTPVSRNDAYLSPNEPVYSASRKYSPEFCLWQLLGWFMAGTDGAPLSPPDLFGTVQLPSIASCFGSSETPYGNRQQMALRELLADDRRQGMPWSSQLRTSFSHNPPTIELTMNSDGSVSYTVIDHGISRKEEVKDSNTLYGSPFLDVSLGAVDSAYKALDLLGSGGLASMQLSSLTDTVSTSSTATQFDNILPPEQPTHWVQCERCEKWRRVPWHIDPSTLSDDWTCPQNTWDSDTATCDAPEDAYDPLRESTIDGEDNYEEEPLPKKPRRSGISSKVKSPKATPQKRRQKV